MTQLDDTLSREAEGKKEPEPPRAWKNRWLAKVRTGRGICEQCGALLPAMAPGDEYVSHCSFSTRDEAELDAAEIMAAPMSACWYAYLGAFPVPVSP